MATQQPTSPIGDDQVAQLTALIARQQCELEELRAQAATEALVDLATGVLSERLRCSPGEAVQQLTRLAARSGMPLVELAADVIGQPAGDALIRGAARPLRYQPARLAETPPVQRAVDGPRIAAAALEEALAPLGAVAVALWIIEPDGALELAGEAGLGALEASRWQRIPPQMDSVAQRVVRDGCPQWWPASHQLPRQVPLVGQWRGARVVLPLADAGALLGAMEICWPHPLEEFAPAVRHQLLALAEVCARSLGVHGERAWGGRGLWLPALLNALLRSALVAHAVRDHNGRIIDFQIDYVSDGFVDPTGRDPHDLVGRRLSHVHPLMTIPNGLFGRAVEVLLTGRPYQADGLIIRVIVGGRAVAMEMDVRIGRLFDGIAITWQPTNATDDLTAILQHAQRLGELGGWQQDVLTGDVRWTDHTFTLFRLTPGAPGTPVSLQGLDAYVHTDDLATVDRFRDVLLNQMRPAATTFRLIRADGVIRQIRAFAEPVTDTAGTLVAVRGTYQDLSTLYHTQVALAATRNQLADTEQRADDQQRLAVQLQRAITPFSADPVEATGLDVAVRYRPADQDHLVGGDWYDSVILPSKEVLLAVGDIAGHGIKAVTGMVTLRNSLRGLAMTGAGPAQLLRWLNDVAYHLTDNITGTAVCGLYNPATRTLRWACAGHLPPVLVRDGTACTLPLPQGVLLGADAHSTYEETATPLRLDDGILLFTDGLIERRGIALDEALDTLVLVAGQPIADLQQYADHLLRHTTPDTDDDTCLIAVHLR
ncbi:SpoIIE family protein phosphatase [Candidatus Protofrankia californiensis]|uniref:SpoIIE family protein phosphatase n=1 Tax=Candidatus Protofrankia californiensis TaxID=1839754 RepID=UPI0010410F1C|nr:SpoIIE family protein phosphatase [Candidatus Protofrankia californiensis]